MDFTVDRVFMKLFKTENIETVRELQAFLGLNFPDQCLASHYELTS